MSATASVSADQVDDVNDRHRVPTYGDVSPSNLSENQAGLARATRDNAACWPCQEV